MKPSNIEEFVKYQLEKKKYKGQSIVERLTKESISELVFVWDEKGENLTQYNNPSDYIARIVEYCKEFDFKLRDIEKFCLKLNIILSQFKINLFLDFLLVLLAIQVKDSNVYNFYVNASTRSIYGIVNHGREIEEKVKKETLFFEDYRGIKGFSTSGQSFLDFLCLAKDADSKIDTIKRRKFIEETNAGRHRTVGSNHSSIQNTIDEFLNTFKPKERFKSAMDFNNIIMYDFISNLNNYSAAIDFANDVEI